MTMRPLILALSVAAADGCSNLLIPAGSTKDGSTILSYSADSGTLYGDLYHWPAAKHAKGDLREIWGWDASESCAEFESCAKAARLGAIPQPENTYNVVGNTNEHQLSITETTFGGLQILNGAGSGFGNASLRAVCNKQYGCIDYGQLIWVTLQRAKTAHEAITTIDHLLQTYGYASSGESFSIADPKEVWMMELIGKGNFSKGAVWVAVKIPDGHVAAHANQARIRTFPRDQPDSVRFANDVVSFAREIGLYKGAEEDFSYSDVYDPVTFSGARFCEARVYSFFESVAAPEVNIGQYLDYAKGYNLSNRMPLYVKTNQRLTVNDTMWHMRNHYEGTWFDPTVDVGAGRFSSPYRLGSGLRWTYKGKNYVNERNIGVNVAAWNVITNQRPNQKYSVSWWGPDDSTFSPHTPFYGATARIPTSFTGANCTSMSWCREKLGLPGTMYKFNFGSMHWVTNMVANYAYSSYAAISQTVKQKLVEHEAQMFEAVEAADRKIASAGADSAEVATQFSYSSAENLYKSWSELYGELFMTYVDGYKVTREPKNPSGFKKVAVGWADETKAAVVDRSGDKYHVPESDSENNDGKFAVIDKLSLRALGGSMDQSCEDSKTEEEVVI